MHNFSLIASQTDQFSNIFYVYTIQIESNSADEDLLNFAKDDLIKVLGDEYNKKKKKVANMDSLMDMRTRAAPHAYM